MNDELITAIANKYAEEVIKESDPAVLPICLQNEVMPLIAMDMWRNLNWLSERYYIVEKSKVESMYANAKEISSLPKSIEAKGYAISRVNTIEALFPEIGKEVKE